MSLDLVDYVEVATVEIPKHFLKSLMNQFVNLKRLDDINIIEVDLEFYRNCDCQYWLNNLKMSEDTIQSVKIRRGDSVTLLMTDDLNTSLGCMTEIETSASMRVYSNEN